MSHCTQGVVQFQGKYLTRQKKRPELSSLVVQRFYRSFYKTQMSPKLPQYHTEPSIMKASLLWFTAVKCNGSHNLW